MDRATPTVLYYGAGSLGTGLAGLAGHWGFLFTHAIGWLQPEQRSVTVGEDSLLELRSLILPNCANHCSQCLELLRLREEPPRHRAGCLVGLAFTDVTNLRD